MDCLKVFNPTKSEYIKKRIPYMVWKVGIVNVLTSKKETNILFN